MMPMGAVAGQMPQGQAPRPAPQAPVMQASGGLAGLPTPEHDYAAGGIVAFNGENGSLTLPPGTPFDAEETGTYIEGSGGEANPTALSRAQEALDRYMDFEPKEMSEKEQEAFLDRYMSRMKTAAGPDIYAPARADLTARKAALTSDRRSGEGLALLTAAGKVLKGHRLSEGLSEALPAFAQQMGEVQKAEQQEKRAIAQMNFALDDAQRKERMGDARGAQAALAEARKFQQDVTKAQSDKLRYGADIAARTVGYSKTTGKGAGSGPKVAEQLAAAEYDNLMATSKPKEGESQTAFEARIRAQALRATQAQLAQKQTFSLSDNPEEGPKAKALKNRADIDQARLDADIQEKAGKAIDAKLWNNTEYTTAQRAERQAAANNQPYTGKTSKQVRDELVAAEARRIKATGGAAATSAPQTALPMPTDKADLKPNQLYNTNRGLAIWNGTAFVPQ
jgi:hypothetical protein